MNNTVKTVPFIAHMIFVHETIIEEPKKQNDNSYYNTKLDYDSEYCQNTTAWD